MPTNCQLYNNLAPDLRLELSSDNGPKWGSFKIDFGSFGNIPWSKNGSTNWSPWDIKDQQGNYYGTITLHSDGAGAYYNGQYAPGQKGFGLEGIHFDYDGKTGSYKLSADQIISNAQNQSPFPDTPLAVPITYQDSTEKIVFSVSGNQIVNSRGNPVTLKGFARPSLEWNPQGQMLSVEDLRNMSRWGVNCVRLSLNQNYWFSSGPASEMGSYKQIINAIVQEASQLGMAVILDLHWTENGHQSNMANQQSLQFWDQVATDYKDFGTVIFELFNEPFGIDPSVWLRGNDSYVGYQQLYDTVRNTKAKNVCIVNGLDWGYDLSFINENFKVDGYNIVYGSHPYNDKANLDRMESNFKGVLGKYPMIFTEFGVNSSTYFPQGYQEVYENIMQISLKYGINYTAWAWWVENNPSNANVFPCIISDWNGTPMNGGNAVLTDLNTHPVKPIDSKSPVMAKSVYTSPKKIDLHQAISDHIEMLQSEVIKSSILYKIGSVLANLIPLPPFLNPVRGIGLFLLNQLLDVDGKAKNNEKITALQTILTIENSEAATAFINNSPSLNHHRNLFKRIVSFFIPSAFRTESKRLAEKLARILPHGNSSQFSQDSVDTSKQSTKDILSVFSNYLPKSRPVGLLPPTGDSIRSVPSKSSNVTSSFFQNNNGNAPIRDQNNTMQTEAPSYGSINI